MSTRIICDYCSKVMCFGEESQLWVNGKEPLFHDVDFCPECLEKVKEGIRNMFNEPTREQIERAKPTKNKVELDRRRCIDLWNAGKKPGEIAKEMNVPAQTIYYQLKKFRLMYGGDIVDDRAIPYELPKVGDDE